MSPRIVPAGTDRLTPSSATVSPNCRVAWSTKTASCPGAADAGTSVGPSYSNGASRFPRSRASGPRGIRGTTWRQDVGSDGSLAVASRSGSVAAEGRTRHSRRRTCRRRACNAPATHPGRASRTADGRAIDDARVPTRARASTPPPDTSDARDAARDAGLRYSSDASPGITPASRRSGLQLSRARWPSRRGHRDPAPDQGARHPAGLDRRLDLPLAERPPAGDRPGRARAQAVPLPPAMADPARRPTSSTG